MQTSALAQYKSGRSNARSLQQALLICFALSGATGLVYEVLWGRMLALVFGSTTAATATVLAVFMGGLALGGRLAGQRADHLTNPLRLYAFLEIGIGLCALMVPLVLAVGEPLYRLVWRTTDGAIWAMTLIRFTLACVALLPPTLLMGATLPILSRTYADREETLGARVGALYAVNTLGASVGALLAGFTLLPALGLSGTIWATALVNFAIAAAVYLLQNRAQAPPQQPDRAESVERRGADLVPSLQLSTMIILVGFGLSGAVALIYEVTWTRALLLIVGSNVQAFAAMLTVFLLGLFLGGLAAAWVVDRLRNPMVALAWGEAACGLAAWTGHLLFSSLPWMSLELLQSQPHTALVTLFVRLWLTALVTFPTAFCLGTLFPLAVRAGAPALAHLGRQVGDLYAANTVGAILGSLLAGFLLLPHLGTQQTLRAAMIANMLIGAGFFLASLRAGTTRDVAGDAPKVAQEGSPKRLPKGSKNAPVQDSMRGSPRDLPQKVPQSVVLSLVAFMALLIWVAWPTSWEMLPIVLAQSTRRETAIYLDTYHQMPYVSQADFEEQMRSTEQLLYSADGLSSHVAVIRNEVNTSLLTNGHSDGSDNTDMPTQILLAAIPMLLYPSDPAPDSVAVVGWGTGVTGGVAEQFPLQQLTAFELEPKVLQASNYFRQVNHDALQDPRLKVVLEDGRNALLVEANSRYDMIISEPSNAWQAGVCNLFTQDFFRLCRKRLRPNGLFTQWIGYGSLPLAEIRGVLAALQEVFPNLLLFRVDDTDAIIVASARPLSVDMARVQARIERVGPVLKADLSRAGMPTAAHLAARILMGPDEIRAFCGRETPNTDDNARLEFAAAADYEQRSHKEVNGRAFAAACPADPLKYVVPSEPADACRQVIERAKDEIASPQH